MNFRLKTRGRNVKEFKAPLTENPAVSNTQTALTYYGTGLTNLCNKGWEVTETSDQKWSILSSCVFRDRAEFSKPTFLSQRSSDASFRLTL